MSSAQLERVLSAYGDASKAPLLQSQAPQLISDEEQNDARAEHDNETSHENVCDNLSRKSVFIGCFFFCICCGGSIVKQYLPLYYRDLGFNAQDIGILESAQPFVAILYTPFIGYIADRFSIKRYILVFSFILRALARMGIYNIPRIRINNCDSYFNESTQYEFTNNCSTSIRTQCSSFKLASIYNAHDLEIVFVYLVVINIIDQLVSAPSAPISDSYVLGALGTTQTIKFGYFKGIGGIGHCWGLLLGGILLSLATYIIEYCSFWIEKTDFFMIFAIGTVLLFAASPLAWLMTNESHSEKSKSHQVFNIWKLASDLCYLRYVSSIIVIIWLATVSGKMRTFDFWYIKFLNGSYMTMGVGGFISRLFYTITMFALPTLSKTVGHIPILIAGCIIVGSGCLVASTITNVYMMIIPLISKEIATAIYIQAKGGFIGSAVDDQYQAFVQSVLTSLTYGIGKGLGSILGGGLIQFMSPAMSYYIFAAGSLIMAIFLSIVYALEKLSEQLY